MVGVPVPAVGIVGNEGVGFNGADCVCYGLRLWLYGFCGERVAAGLGVGGWFAVFAPHHAGVAVNFSCACGGGGCLAQVETAGNTQGAGCSDEFAGAVFSQRFPVIGAFGVADLQVFQVFGDDLTHFSAGKSEQVYFGAFTGVGSHCCAR